MTYIPGTLASLAYTYSQLLRRLTSYIVEIISSIKSNKLRADMCAQIAINNSSPCPGYPSPSLLLLRILIVLASLHLPFCRNLASSDFHHIMADIQNLMQYKFRDHKLLDEALTAAGQDPTTERRNTRGNSNKALALIGDAVLRLILIDDAVRSGSSTCMYNLSITASKKPADLRQLNVKAFSPRRPQIRLYFIYRTSSVFQSQ